MARSIARLLLALGLLATCAAPARAAEKQAENLHHPVFAHYMLCYFNSVEHYQREIELAQRHGLDGFVLNVGRWDGSYQGAAERIYEAAKRSNSDFKLFFSPDFLGLGGGGGKAIAEMVKTYENHPNQFRWNGETVISSYGGMADAMVRWVAEVEKEGHPVCLVPFAWNPRLATTWSYDTALNYYRSQPKLDGMFNFAADMSVWDNIRTNANGKRAAIQKGKIFMAGVSPNYNSANLRDFHGVHGYGAVWEALTRDNADWVEITTWSDFNEDSNLMPFRWPGGCQKAYYTRDESFLDATDYYVKWYKSGRQPEIVQDKVYLAYRARPKHFTRAWDMKEEKWVSITGDQWPRDQLHDDVDDAVYATAFLTAPAKLTLSVGDSQQSVDLPAGIQHVVLPKTAGVPAVRLERDGKVLLDFVGRRQIIGEITKENSPFGYHLLNRLWAQADVVGKPITLQAESGELAEGAEVVAQGNTKAVANKAVDGSGFKVPVQGLKTGTYSVRITYSNPSPHDARLTLFADGVQLAEKDFPYYIPAFMPPTGKDQFATISFLWTLYDKTSYLNLQWQKEQPFFGRVKEGEPWGDDRGEVLVDKIELVKVEQSPMPERIDGTMPEMVQIPGGEFQMGTTEGDVDETPVHKVKVSDFVIGKYEITNEQYEAFDPNHRRFRDEFSWRDREPVIYVKWRDAADYCNWLSKKAGLQPVYGEKYKIDTKANGFRLPTEAEWEYVASGRGEGRTYPWGEEPVDQTRANVVDPSQYTINPHVRSAQGGGVMVVGTYPAGASRDGIMDLAGNVSEWCNDTYHPYSAEPQTNPLDDTEGAYKAIRGGSWGFYGSPQRVTDREYNNAGYPGLQYVGFRIAAPAASWAKVAQQSK